MTSQNTRIAMSDAEACDLRRYHQLLATTNAIPIEFSQLTGRISYIDDKIEGLLGYPVTEWYAREFWVSHIHPDDRDWVPLYSQQAADRGEAHDFEYRMIAADGRTIWLRESLVVVRDNAGHETLQGFIFDITAQKQALNAMEALASTINISDTNEFFQGCVKNLAGVYGAKFAFIGLILPSRQDVRTLSVWAGDTYADNFEYNLAGTPCKDIIYQRKELIPRNAAKIYAEDVLLTQMGIESYFGSLLVNSSGGTIGLVSIMDVKPMVLNHWTAPILGIFASRIAVELERNSSK